jgi:general secretion pathway protein I
MSLMSSSGHKGFTLVEVMVALAVVAVALPALMVALYQQVDGTAYLRDKSFAHMVAANKLVEIRILAESTRQLPQGKVSGVAEMADREWYWLQLSTKTEFPNFQRIEISVAASEEQIEQPLIKLAAFLSSDLELGDVPGPDDE